MKTPVQDPSNHRELADRVHAIGKLLSAVRRGDLLTPDELDKLGQELRWIAGWMHRPPTK
jgi:hypothetical protein